MVSQGAIVVPLVFKVSIMAQGDLKFVIFLPQPLECWDYRHVLPCWAGTAVLCGNAATCVSGLLPVNTSTLSLELGTQQ